MSKDPSLFRIQDGLSIVRYAHETPGLQSVTNRLASEHAENPSIRVRHFGGNNGESDPRQPSIRLFKTIDIQGQFPKHRKLSAERTLLSFVIDSVMSDVPFLFRPDENSFSYENPEHRFDKRRKQWLVVARPDEESRKSLEYERRTSLRAIQKAVEVGQTDWPSGQFELVLATAALGTKEKIVQGMAHLIAGYGAIELSFAPAQFDPDPLGRTTPAQS